MSPVRKAPAGNDQGLNLYNQVLNKWKEKHDINSNNWANYLIEGEDKILEASKLVNEAKPLRFYLNATEIGSGDNVIIFSLRYRGQEVAKVKITIAKKEAMLVIKDHHEKTNMDDFHIDTPRTKGIPWDKAGDFRAKFRKLNNKAQSLKRECEIESWILEELEGRVGATKFNGTLRNVRHAGPTKHEYPIQYPLPLSAHTGTPTDGRGNVDILVRHNGRLSIWEIKRPGTTENTVRSAVRQAYIYAVTVAKMLRSPSGPKWFKIWGFTRQIPSKLKIEAVVVMEDDRNIYTEQFINSEFQFLKHFNMHKLTELNAEISFHTLYYNPIKRTVEWVDHPNFKSVM